MNDIVWVSDMLADSEVSLFVTNDLRHSDIFLEGINLLKKGAPVQEGACPKRIWGSQEEDAPALSSVPDLFCANGQYIVSEKAAKILRQFDLGGGALYSVSEGVYQNDNLTRIPGDCFTWIFGNVKTAFLPDETLAKRPFGVAGTRWNMPFVVQDGDIAVSKFSLDGPDVWMDPTLMRAVFLSGQLGQALSDAGIAHAFRLKTCRVI
ncbi:hypothetical protein [Sphingobium sp. LMC3-1-1.1]|uniref:hypothetical protein n=1 Tax=unclassified Sphingobium TaxID=2611147 RepID=UPI00343D4CA5